MKITLHDMTLRDGMHPKRHLMTLEQMKHVATGLDEVHMVGVRPSGRPMKNGQNASSGCGAWT